MRDALKIRTSGDRAVTDLRITEAGSVQFPMVRHAAEIGWTPIPPQVAMYKRGGEAGMLFRGELEAALGRFNPWMTEDAARSAVERLEALPPTIEGNREMLAWLRGARQWYDESERRHRPVRLVDFRDAGRQRPSRHLGVEAQAAGPQGQPGGCDVRRQRGAGRDRRAQESDGRGRHRARRHATAALRAGDPRADGRPRSSST